MTPKNTDNSAPSQSSILSVPNPSIARQNEADEQANQWEKGTNYIN